MKAWDPNDFNADGTFFQLYFLDGSDKHLLKVFCAWYFDLMWDVCRYYFDRPNVLIFSMWFLLFIYDMDFSRR